MALTKLLQRGDPVPHFVLRRPDGSRWEYSATTWQRRNLLLLMLPAHTDVTDVIYVDQLLKHTAELSAFDTTWVLTREPIAGLPSPGVLVADRWGEIYLVAGAPHASQLPPASEILECLRYVDHECPECQGEAH